MAPVHLVPIVATAHKTREKSVMMVTLLMMMDALALAKRKNVIQAMTTVDMLQAFYDLIFDDSDRVYLAQNSV